MRARRIPRGFRVAPLCVYKQAVSPLLHILDHHFPWHSLLVCSPSSSRHFSASPPTSLLFLVSLCTPSPACWMKGDRDSPCRFLPTRPLPSRPLRFKSPCDGGGGREDMNFTWHGNASVTAMLNREMRLCISEARSKISQGEASQPREPVSFFTLFYAKNFDPRFYIKYKICLGLNFIYFIYF